MNTQTLASQSGVTFRQLDHWVRRGWLKPEGGTGSGHDREWSVHESQIARAMGGLVQYGIPPQLAHDLARHGMAGAVQLLLDRLPKEEAQSA